MDIVFVRTFLNSLIHFFKVILYERLILFTRIPLLCQMKLLLHVTDMALLPLYPPVLVRQGVQFLSTSDEGHSSHTERILQHTEKILQQQNLKSITATLDNLECEWNNHSHTLHVPGLHVLWM